MDVISLFCCIFWMNQEIISTESRDTRICRSLLPGVQGHTVERRKIPHTTGITCHELRAGGLNL